MAEEKSATMMAQTAEAEKKKAAPAKKRVSRAKGKVIVVRSKRKTSIARAYIKAGTGRIRINNKDVSATESEFARNIMLEPLAISDTAKEVAKKADIKVIVYGGGASSQMQAVRGAIAKSIVAFSGNDSLKNEILRYERSLLVDDPRRVEPKKFKGPKARARFQTSYR